MKRECYYLYVEDWEDGILYEDEELVRAEKDIATAVIRPGTAVINAHAFSGCANLTEVVFPEGLT